MATRPVTYQFVDEPQAPVTYQFADETPAAPEEDTLDTIAAKYRALRDKVGMTDTPQDMALQDTTRQALGAGETALSLGTGALSAPVAATHGIGTYLANRWDGKSRQEAVDAGGQARDATAASMTYAPRTETGQQYANAIGTAGKETIGRVGDTLGYYGDKVSPEMGVAARALPTAATMMLPGMTAPGAAYRGSLSRTRAARIAEEPQYDAVTREGIKAGYKVSPTHTEANPTLTNRALESTTGKARIENKLNRDNQENTNGLAMEAVNLPRKSKITPALLDRELAKAGRVYDEIDKLPVRFHADRDPQYQADLAEITRSVDTVSKSFPVSNTDPLRLLAQRLRQPVIAPDAAMALIKSERAKAGEYFKAADSPNPMKPEGDQSLADLGHAHQAAADALEGLVERHLRYLGKNDLYDRFVASRQQIAKLHGIKNALTEGSGNVNARSIARQLTNKPYEGPLRTIAKFYEAHPQLMRADVQAAQLASTPDVLMSGLGAGLSMLHPLGALGAVPLVAHATLPSLIASRGAQKLMRTHPLDAVPALGAAQKAALPGELTSALQDYQDRMELMRLKEAARRAGR